MKYLFSLILLTIFTGCQLNSLDHYALNHWVGHWEQTDSSGTFIETWQKVNDTLYEGHGRMIIQKDTVFSEKIHLIFKDKKVQYVVLASGQNDDKEVSFEMTSFTKDRWIFENPKHDFPNKITYFSPTTDSLIATVEGIRDTVPTSFTLRFKRK